jgi:hypothetical protein
MRMTSVAFSECSCIGKGAAAVALSWCFTNLSKLHAPLLLHIALTKLQVGGGDAAAGQPRKRQRQALASDDEDEGGYAAAAAPAENGGGAAGDDNIDGLFE